MSLEDKIEKLTSAVEALTEQVSTQNETVSKALSGKSDGAASKPASTGGKASTGKASGGKASGGKASSSKKKATTAEDVRGVFGPYLTGAKDVPTKKRLIATTKPLLEHFGVERITEVAEDQRDEAIKYGKMLSEAFEEGGIDAAEEVTFPFMDEEGDGDGDEDGDEDDGVL